MKPGDEVIVLLSSGVLVPAMVWSLAPIPRGSTNAWWVIVAGSTSPVLVSRRRVSDIPGESPPQRRRISGDVPW